MRPIDFLEILKNGFRTRLLAQANSDIDISLPSSPGTLSRIEDLRPKATSEPIFYVSTTGSDSNDGLTVGTAFATIQKAIDTLATIDCNGLDPIIYLAAGSHIVYTPIYTKNIVGVGSGVSIVGLGSTPNATKILSGNQGGNGGYQNSVVVNYARTIYLFQNIEITHQWDDIQYPTYPKYIVNLGGKLLFNGVRIRGNGASHDCFVGYSGGSWDYQNTLEIQGTFRWIFDVGGASVNLRETTIASISNPTCAIFAKAYSTYFAAYNITLTGTLTGKRFELAGSTIDTVGFALNFPGTIDGTHDALAVGATPLSHLSASDPHPQYLTQAEADSLYSGLTAGDKGDITVSVGGVWSIDDGVIDNDNIASNAGIEWSKISKTGAAAGDVGAIASTQLGANNGVAQLGTTGKHLPGQSLPSSVTYTSSTGVFDFTWADNSTQSINLPIENLFQNASYNASTQTLTLTTNGGGTLDISLATLVDLPEIVVAQSDPATTPTTGQRLYLRSDTGEYWIAASGAWQGKYLAFTAAERSKLAGIETGAINQTTADGRYRQLSSNIPANEITGTFTDNQIPSSIARDTEVAAAVTAHETTFNHSSFATTTQLNNLRNEVGMIGTAFTNTSAANAAAVITVAAPDAGQCLQLNQLTFSYSGAPTNGLLTIHQASTVIHETAITASGAGPTIAGYKLAGNTAMTITLAAGGSGVIGRVSASVSTVPA